MKKILSLILMTAFVFVCYSQEIREPQFAGEGILVKNNNITKLEKNIVKLETNSGMAVMWGAAIKTNIEIKGAKSPVRTTTEEPIVLIVKALNNEYDPTAFINIFKFNQTKKYRKATLSKEGVFGKSKGNTLEYIDYTAEKYGEKSYKLVINVTEPCEIGIIMTNPDRVDEKQLVVSCLGID